MEILKKEKVLDKFLAFDTRALGCAVVKEELGKGIIKKVKGKVQRKRIDLTGLDSMEKKVVGILQRENGGFFQKSLMEELGVGKVKMTRMMDKLEAKGIVERKRRGMNNIIVLVR